MYKLICILTLSIAMLSGCANQKLTDLENNDLQPINNDMLKNAVIDNINRGDYVKK